MSWKLEMMLEDLEGQLLLPHTCHTCSHPQVEKLEMMLEDLEGQLQESAQQQEEAEAELEAVRGQLRQAQGAAAAAAGAVGVAAVGAAAAANVASSRKVCIAVLSCAWADAPAGGRTHAVVCGSRSIL